MYLAVVKPKIMKLFNVTFAVMRLATPYIPRRTQSPPRITSARAILRL